MVHQPHCRAPTPPPQWSGKAKQLPERFDPYKVDELCYVFPANKTCLLLAYARTDCLIYRIRIQALYERFNFGCLSII